jgi:hypothetical protein
MAAQNHNSKVKYKSSLYPSFDYAQDRLFDKGDNREEDIHEFWWNGSET